MGILERTRTLSTSCGFYFTASSCPSLMSQSYQPLISCVLGIVGIPQDLRQALLNPHGTDTLLPWQSCGEVQGLTLETSTDQCSLAHLKLPAGTKAFHINWMAPDAQSLGSLQKVAFRFADLKAECPVRLMVDSNGP